MNVSGDYVFEGGQELVWGVLLDPEVLRSVLPGCEKLELVGEDSYEGDLQVKVGPVQGKFHARIDLEDVEKPHSYTLKVDGRGAPGFVNATGRLKLMAAGDRTNVSYEGDARVGGRLASVGQRLIESSAKAIIQESMDGLNNAVKARVEARETGEEPPPPELTSPTQADFAAAVAKEVAKDFAPTLIRAVAIVAVAAALLYVVFQLVT